MTTDPPMVNLLAKTLAAELATVDAPQDIAGRRELLALYLGAGLAQPAEAELARLLVQFSWDHGVLSDVLNLRRDLHQPTELMRFAKIAESLPDRSEGLRLALAQAFAAVGELEAAAKEFGALLQTDSGRKGAAGAIATFVRSHPDLPALRSALIKLCYLHPDLLLEPPLRYAVFRAAADLDKPLARQQLPTMFHPAIAATDLILDVAIQAWRLGRWDDAARARYPHGARIMNAYREWSVTTWSADGLGLSVEDVRPIVESRGLTFPPPRELGANILSGSTEEAVAELVVALRQRRSV